MNARLKPIPAPLPATAPAMRRIPGGTFPMGSDRHSPEEAPAHLARVARFEMDETAATNRPFAAFVAATGHVAIAERPRDPSLYPGADPARLGPGGPVFRMTAGPVDTRDVRDWWRWTPGARRRRPEGPESSIKGREDPPVVPVAYEEAEKPSRRAADDPRGPAREASLDPAQPGTPIPRKVAKGGSFLRAPSRRRRRPAARPARRVDTGMSHIGFRRVRRLGRVFETTSSGSRPC